MVPNARDAQASKTTSIKRKISCTTSNAVQQLNKNFNDPGFQMRLIVATCQAQEPSSMG